MWAPKRSPRPWLPVFLALGSALAAACRGPSEKPQAPTLDPDPPPLIEVRVGQTNLLFSYRDPTSGRLETVASIAEVPEAARSSVFVVDLALSPEERGAARYVQIVDLRAAGPDARYPVAVASRYGFDRRRAPTDASEGDSSESVVLYSASWCGVCKKAQRLLRELQVPFENKDVEASRSAREELQAKAARAGLRPSGVPVIDVAGRLMVGLDPERLEASLREAGLLSE